MASISTQPIDKEEDGRWFSQHTRFVHQSKECEPDVVFIGDSLILQLQFTQWWRQNIEPLHALNFGIESDETQHVLWRLDHDELNGMTPRAVVVCVGTHNDCRSHTPQDVADAIKLIVEKITQLLPNTAIIILGLLPCGRTDNPRRQRNKKINQLLHECLSKFPNYSSDSRAPAKQGDGNSVTFVDFNWDAVIQADHSISHRDMYDYLHPTEQCYAKILTPLLVHLNHHCLQSD